MAPIINPLSRNLFSVIFAVPGKQQHGTTPDVVQKRGHKFTALLLVLSFVLTTASVMQDKLQTIKYKIGNGAESTVYFGWEKLRLVVSGSTNETFKHYDTDMNNLNTSENAGKIFFIFSIASLVIFGFLTLLSIMFALRRPRSLIQENGSLLRSIFLILNMIVALLVLTSWSAWMASFKVPDTLNMPGGAITLTGNIISKDISESIILNIISFVLQFFAVFTGVIQY